MPELRFSDSISGTPSAEEVTLSKLNLGELSLWLNTYNRQFSLGALAGRATIGRDDQAESTVLDSSAREQRLSFSEIERRTKDLLTQSGLALEAVKGGGVVLSSNLNAPDYPMELRVNLSDGKRFARYLEVLRGNTLEDGQRTGLIDVAGSITTQLKTHYQLENSEDDRLLELFGNASHIIGEYERLETEGSLGLSDSIKELKRLVDVARKGYLREELLVEQEGLLAEVGGRNFGPSRWHVDTSEALYKDYWSRALATVHSLEKNPKASSLLTRVKENLKASMDYAKRDITERLKDESKSSFEWWNNQAFQFLDTVREEIENAL
ncbi:MAG: hypothetical protein Q7S86_04685 [bacterium]|nr:hypothetical protein [bacterium]